MGQRDSGLLLLGKAAGTLSLRGQMPDEASLVGLSDLDVELVGKATPLRPGIHVTCMATDNGNGTWTYDFTVWNYMETVSPYAGLYVDRWGVVVADNGTQESPANWADAGSWRHNDPYGGDPYYGFSAGGEPDADDLTVPVFWSASSEAGRIQPGIAVNGFRITLSSHEASFVWLAYGRGYAATYPGLSAGSSRKEEFGAWFDALWPENPGVSEAYWEYAITYVVEVEE